MTKCLFQLLIIFVLLLAAAVTVSAQQTVVDLPADSQLNPVLDLVTIENGPPFGGLDYDSYYQLSTPGLYSGTITYHIKNVSKVSVLASSQNGSFASVYQTGLIRGYNSSNLGSDPLRLSQQPGNDLLLAIGNFGTFCCYLNQYSFAFGRVELDASKEVFPYGVNILYSSDGSRFISTQGKFTVKDTIDSGRYVYLEEYSAPIPKSAQFIQLKLMNAPYLTAPDGSKSKNIESLLAVLQTTFTVEPDEPSSSSSSEESSSSSSSSSAPSSSSSSAPDDNSSSSSSSSSESPGPDESSSSSSSSDPGGEGPRIIYPSGSSGGKGSSSRTRSYNNKVHPVPNVPKAEEGAGRTDAGSKSPKRSSARVGAAPPVAGDSYVMPNSSADSSSGVTIGSSLSSSASSEEEREEPSIIKGIRDSNDIIQNPGAMEIFFVAIYAVSFVALFGRFVVLKLVQQIRLKGQGRKKK